MKRNRKSVLALLLALCMAMSLLCGSVWAAEDESVPDESAPAVEVQEAKASGDESVPEVEEEAPAQEPEEEPKESAPETEEETDAPELDAQEKVDYYATNLTVTSSQDVIGLKWTVPSKLNSIMIKTQGVVVEGCEKGTNAWKTLYSSSGSSDVRTTNSLQSGEGYWKDLKLVSRHTYQFRVYYTDGSDKGPYSNVVETTYYSSKQELDNLKEDVNAAKSGQGETFLNGSTLTIMRPLYTVNLTLQGQDSDGNFLFHADVTSPFKDNGFEESDSRYVRGLEFVLDGIYYIQRKNGEKVYHSLASRTSEDFTVESEDMAFGCNYLQLRLDAYNHDEFNLPEYFEETPMYLNIRVSKVPLDAGSAISDKSSFTLRTYDWAGGSVKTYEKTIPGIEHNVTESGLYVWYRKKGASSWTKKTLQSGKAAKIKGLSANTIYEWKAQYYMKSESKETGEIKTLTSDETSVYQVCTADKNKPKVKSSKCSGIKYAPHEIAAHWEKNGTNSWKWVKTQKWTTTEYTLKITLKSVPKNVKGLLVNGSPYKLKGKTVSVKLSTGGKSKGKTASINLQTYTNSNGSGAGPKMKYSYKIK